MITNNAKIKEDNPIVKGNDEPFKGKDRTIEDLAEKLTKQIHLFSGIYHAMTEGLMLVDLTGKIRFVNKQFLEILNEKGMGFLGSSIDEKLSIELFNGRHIFTSETLEEVSRTKTGKKYAGIELIVRGMPVLVDLKIHPLLDLDENVECIALFCRENNSAKLLAEEMAKNEALTKIGQLAAGVAHEVRNPLQTVGGLMDVLRSKYGNDSNINRYSDIVTRELKHINNILTEFLRFSRPQKLDKAMKNINDICSEVIVLMVCMANLNGIRLTEKYAPNVPNIFLDEYKIKQVLINLITNAIDATKGFGSEIVVETGYYPEQKKIFFRVSDNGCGIPQDVLSEIYNTFFTTKEHGTGLGLPICNQIVAEHDGRIMVESEEGKGTTFTVIIPDKIAIDQERA